MKKKAVSLLLVAAMAAGMLAGCGNGKSSVSQNGSDGSKGIPWVGLTGRQLMRW